MTETELKRSVRRRIDSARADGVSIGEIAKEAGPEVGIGVLLGMINAERIPVDLWSRVDEALSNIGY